MRLNCYAKSGTIARSAPSPPFHAGRSLKSQAHWDNLFTALLQTVVAVARDIGHLKRTSLRNYHLAGHLPVFPQAQINTMTKKEMHGPEDKVTEINLLGTGFK